MTPAPTPDATEAVFVLAAAAHAALMAAAAASLALIAIIALLAYRILSAPTPDQDRKDTPA